MPEELRKHILLGKGGTIDVSALKGAKSDNAALQGLLRLASSKTMYDIVSADSVSFREGNGANQTWRMEDAAIKGLFLPGEAAQNMFSRPGTPTSQNGRNVVYLWSGLPTMERNEILKEELLGHALLFDLNLKYQHEILPSEGRAVNTFIFRVLLGQPYPR